MASCWAWEAFLPQLQTLSRLSIGADGGRWRKYDK